MSIADKLTTIAENVPKVYEAGKAAGGGVDAGLDLFWETYQQGGARTDYQDKFGDGNWTNETFRPKYTVWFSGNQHQFRNPAVTDYELLKMINFSKVQNWSDYFREAPITHLPELDTRGTYGNTSLYQMFYKAKIEVVDKLIIKDDGNTTFNNAFGGATALTSITFEGVIGQDIYLHDCKNLTHASLMSVIGCLKDYSGTETTKRLQIASANLAKLTDEEKAIATQKGWTLA